MIKVRVPGTTANLGPGFDCLGMAINLHNLLEVTPWETTVVEVHGHGAAFIPTDSSNLALRGLCAVYEAAGQAMPPLRVVQRNSLPTSGGLGSSATGIVSGVFAANELLGRPLDMQGMLSIATGIEGHPDNVAPCLMGGLTASMLEDGRVYAHRGLPHAKWRFAAMVPEFSLSTRRAREALPDTYSRPDAVGNLGRAVLMHCALQSGDVGLLSAACRDSFHEPYRKALIPGWDAVLQAARKCGAVATWLSGAGATIMSVYEADNTAFAPSLGAALAALEDDWTLYDLRCDEGGAARVDD